MNDFKQRKHERKDSLNLIDYTILGTKGDPVTRRMGRTLNVSEGGLLLESHIPLKQGQTILITVALEEDMVDLKGIVAHVKPSGDKSFCSGVEFMEMDKAGKRVLKKYIEAFKAENEN